MDLRDNSTSIWSQPVPSRKLEKEFQQKTWKSTSSFSVPKLHSLSDVVEAAQHQVEVQRLTQLCQKPSDQRTQEDVLLVRKLVSAMCPFFAMWPTMLQEHLAAMLTTEVLVTRENVLSRGLELTKMFIVLSGQLNVLYPETGSSLERSSSNTAGGLVGTSRSQAVGTPKPRVMGVLKKGDTCGEAILLGSQVSHADVVVASPMAVLLSLSLSHFLKAFKEMLGLRQQDRLDFLRCHPMFEGYTLGDLDILAERLQCTIFPVRSVLLPVPSGEAPRTYLLAEGQLVVRRKAGGAGWNPGPAGGDEEGPSRLYDEDTVCVLQQNAVVGSRLSPGHFVTAVTQVKAYWLPTAQLSLLPQNLKAAIEGADGFWAGYHETRKQALSALDRARRHPKYGAYTYKVGDVVMSSIGQAVAPSPTQEPSSPGPGPAGAASTDNGSASSSAVASKDASQSLDAAAAATTAGTSGGGVINSHAARRQAHLHALAAQQVLAVMDASMRKDPRTGLITSNLHAGNVTQSLPSTPSRHRPRSQGSQSASQTFMTEVPADRLPAAEQGSQQGASSTKCPPLGLLHPDQATWPRVSCARPRVVDTQPATHQHPPTSVSHRHAAIHARALMSSFIRPGRSDTGDDSDDESETAMSADGHRQPSRRLSGDHWRRSLPQVCSHSLKHGSGAHLPPTLPYSSHTQEHHMALQVLPEGMQQPADDADRQQVPAASSRKTKQKQAVPKGIGKARKPHMGVRKEKKGGGDVEAKLSPRSAARWGSETGTGQFLTAPPESSGVQGRPADDAAKDHAWDAPVPFGPGHGKHVPEQSTGDEVHESQPARHSRSRVGVPASVVLGYEKMDPLQWAALASHAPGSVRLDMVLSAAAARASISGSAPGPGGSAPAYPSNPSDSILPPPKW